MNKKKLMKKNGNEISPIVSNKENNLNDTNITKKRDSNIELLRIVTMIMIILHHLSLFTNLRYDRPILYSIIVPLGKLGVTIFILISGYFAINKKFSIKKLLLLYLQVWFFSVFLVCISLLILKGFKFNINCIFPVSKGQYWFVNAYIMMYILSPFINKVMTTLSKEVIKKLIITLIMICAVAAFTKVREVIANVFEFVTIYMIGAYIKLYGIEKLKNKKNIDLWFYIMTCWLILFFVQVAREKLGIFEMYNGTEGSIFNIITGVIIFYAFKNMNIKTNKFINYLGKCSFAVYLFHEQIIIRYLLWRGMFANVGKGRGILLKIIGIVIIIWVTTIIIEEIRKLIEKIILNKKVDNKLKKYYDKIDKFFLLEDTKTTITETK